MECICQRETFTALGVSTDEKYRMSLELDIPDEGYRAEGIEPALLVSLYYLNKDEEAMDNIRIPIRYCPLCGNPLIKDYLEH